jgi:elongator complex protein 3
LIKKDAYREIIEYLMKNPKASKKDVNKAKILMVSRYGLMKTPSNSELISRLKPHERNRLLPILRLKEVRTISGVAVVATVTKPHSCPHGKCAYCPGGPQYNLPSAYVGKEPAIMRGIENQFSPYFQVKNRIQQLQAIGHIVDKVEIIVMGGTFPSMDQTYQEHFIQKCLNALTETKTQNSTS